jgi:hypothetical protein
MFGALLGALGPVGWIAGGIITVATVAAASSTGSSPSSNTSSAKREYKEGKKEKLQNDIDDYIKKQTKHIKLKYNADILIDDTLLQSNINFTGIFGSNLNIPLEKKITEAPIITILKKDLTIHQKIKKLRTSTTEIESIIVLLTRAKYEPII